MPTLTYCTGFGHRYVTGTLGTSIWNGRGASGGTISISTSIKRWSSGVSLDLNKSSTSSNTIYLYRTVSTNMLVVRFYFYMQSLPSSGTVTIWSAECTTAPHFELKLTSAGALQAQWVGGTARTSGTTITTGNWYRVELRLNTSSNPTCDWQIQGSDETQATGTTAGTINKYVFGNGTTASSATWRANFTDFATSQTSGDYPLGAGTVYPLVPTGMGTHVNSARFQEGDGTAIDANSYQYVDEWPPTETAANTDYIKQVTADGAGEDSYIELTIGDKSLGGTINGITGVLAYTSNTTSSNNGATLVRRSDGTEIAIWGTAASPADMSDGTLTGLYYKTALITAPGGGWDNTEINALVFRIGYSTDVNPNPFWAALLLEYDATDSITEYITPAGTLTSAGVMGAWLVLLAAVTTLKGTLTEAGALIRQVLLAPTTTLKGTLTSAGALAMARFFTLAAAGAMASAGALAQTVLRTFAGSLSRAATAPRTAGSTQWSFIADEISGNDGDPVSTWLDGSGYGRDASQTGAARPTLKKNIANGHAVVRFTNTQALPAGGAYSFNGAPDSLVLVVARPTGLTTPAEYPVYSTLDYGNGVTSPSLFLSRSGVANELITIHIDDPQRAHISLPVTTDTWYVISYTKIGGVLTARLNGVESALTGSTGYSDSSDFILGGGRNQGTLVGFTGDIAEIHCIQGTFSGTALAKIEQYVSDYYGVGLALTDASLTGMLGAWLIMLVPSGILTSAGAVTKLATQALTGALTAAGTLTKVLPLALVGALTSAGAAVWMPILALAGTVAEAGATAKQVTQSFAGGIAPNATSLNHLIGIPKRIFIGFLQTAGDLTIVKQYTLSASGVLTGAGALMKQPLQVMAGILSGAGILTRNALVLAGGVLANAGGLASAVPVAIAGMLMEAGSLLRLPQVASTGILSDAGMLVRTALQALTGGLPEAGLLTKQVEQTASGTLPGAGGLRWTISHTVTGLLSDVGSLGKQLPLAIAGILQGIGELATQVIPAGGGAFLLEVTGILTAIGSLQLSSAMQLTGILTEAGSWAGLAGKHLAGVLPAVGRIGWSVTRQYSGAIASAGILTRQIGRAVAGILQPAGSLILNRILRLAADAVLTLAAALGWLPRLQIGGHVLTAGRTGPWVITQGLPAIFQPVGTLGKAVSRSFAGSLTFARSFLRWLAGISRARGWAGPGTGSGSGYARMGEIGHIIVTSTPEPEPLASPLISRGRGAAGASDSAGSGSAKVGPE